MLQRIATTRMFRLVSLTGLILALALSASGARAGSGDKELSRVKGSVGYQSGNDAPFKPIFGRQNLGDDAYAVTKSRSLAVLKLVDSSEIDIGENTIVQVGAFQAASSGKQNSIALNNGALHFKIRRPAGGQSNYTFTTPTSQIAVRGTEGFLITGPTGTQVVCTVCTIGDVTVQTGTQTVTLVSGQTLIVSGAANSIGTATQTIVSNAQVNNPAVSQFGSTGTGTVSGNTATNAIGDTTGSTSGSTIGTATGATGGITTGQIITTGVVGGATAVIATTQQPTPGPTQSSVPTVTPVPTRSPVGPPSPVPTLGALTITPATTSNVFASFPTLVAPLANFTLVNYFNGSGAGGPINVSLISASGPGSISAVHLPQNTPDLVGSVDVNITGGGLVTLSITPPGGAAVTATYSAFGNLLNTSGNPPTTNVTNASSAVPQTFPFTFMQAGPSGTQINASLLCQTGTVNPTTPYATLTPLAPIPGSGGTFIVSITGAPDYGGATPPGGPACTLTVKGAGSPAPTQQFVFNISSTGFIIAGHKRRSQTGPTPGPSVTPGPGPSPRVTPPSGPHVRPPGQHPL